MASTGSTEITSVWTKPARERRDQPTLTRDQIVAEAIALLDAGGFDDEVVDIATNAIFQFVVGSCGNEAAMMMTIARSGLSTQQWVDRVMVASEAASQQYPRLHRRYAEQRPQVVEEAANGVLSRFTQAIDLILDGAQTRHAR